MGKYVPGGQIEQDFPRVVGTAGTTLGELEWHVENAEAWLDGRIGRFYNTATFSGNAPPLVRTVTRIRAEATYLQTLITLEDPSQSAWIQRMFDEANDLASELVSGTLAMVTDSGTIIAPTLPSASMIWSSTMRWIPTFNERDFIHQRDDPNKIDEKAREQDTQGIDGLLS